MPLKHRTETALVLLLGLVIALTSALASLLPHLPEGLFFWIVLAVLTIAYPLSLRRTFRENRADHELRLLHWYPAGMLALWLTLELLAPHLEAALVLRLGFFFLFGASLMFLGELLLLLFALHVVRRSSIRVPLLSVIMVASVMAGILAEARGWNDPLSELLFAANPPSRFLTAQVQRFVTWGRLRSWNDIFAVRVPGADGGVPPASARLSSPSSPRPSRTVSSRPRRLPRSGPGDVGLLGLATLSLYTTVVHLRARRRA